MTCARPRGIALIAALLLALSLGACGSDDDGGGNSGGGSDRAQSGGSGPDGSGSTSTDGGAAAKPTPAEQARESAAQRGATRGADRFYDGIAARDPKAVCELLTDEARGKVETEETTCEEYFTPLLKPKRVKGTSKLAKRARVIAVGIDGGKATATVRFNRETTGVIELVRDGGEWRATSFTLPPAR